MGEGSVWGRCMACRGASTGRTVKGGSVSPPLAFPPGMGIINSRLKTPTVSGTRKRPRTRGIGNHTPDQPMLSQLDPTPPDGGESPARGFHPSTPLASRFLYPNLNAPPMHPCARGQGASAAQHVDGCIQQREDEHAHGWILVKVDVPCSVSGDLEGIVLEPEVEGE